MTLFAMRGNTEKKLHGAHSHTRLDIRGSFWMQGPQPVSGLPEWIVKAFEDDPNIMELAINTGENGVLYSRMDPPEP